MYTHMCRGYCTTGAWIELKFFECVYVYD
jgi:hypothetical protein